MTKFALVSLGNEESYGLLYVATELKKHGEIKFFDAEMNPNVIKDIVAYKPDYLCFSPMTAFVSLAKIIEKCVKDSIDTITIYGGHHASNCGKNIGDITVVGSVHNLNLNSRGIVFGGATNPSDLKVPAREEYFRDIPRFKKRYRKIMLSMTGCPWGCSYCSSSSVVTRKVYGNTKCHLKHRDIDDIINEALFMKECTHEIEWVDDDVFYGDKEWAMEFFSRWVHEVGLPMYVSTTSFSALKASPDLLDIMRKVVRVIGLGVQAIRPDSLKILGRSWDSEVQIKKAYDYLVSFGFKVNLQCIVGLPVEDPVEDALDTIDGMRRIGAGSIVSCYPLQVYPNTEIDKYCDDMGYFLNPSCTGDTNSGLPAINFGNIDNNRLKNICKLATMVVKYNISRKWLSSMLDIDISDSSFGMSMVRYYECIKDRLPDKADKIYDEIIGAMHVRY